MARVSWNRKPSNSDVTNPPGSADVRQLLHMNIPSSIAPNDVMNLYPEFNIAGFTIIGTQGNIPNFQFDENYQIASDLALNKGNHSIKMGFDLLRFRLGRFVNDTTNGELNYTNANPTGSGYALADFLLGRPVSSTLDDKPLTVDLRHENLSFFITDKWRASRRLTFDVGLRYEYTPAMNEHYGRMSTFSLTPPGQFNVLQPGEPLYNVTHDNWAPRVGLTYELTKQDLIRGSFGTFYSFPSLLEFVGKASNPPFINSYSFASAPSLPLTNANAFPVGQVATGGLVAPQAWSLNQKTPRVQEWSFGIQHSFSPNVLLDVSYVGNRAAHLINVRPVNDPLTPGLLCPISGPIPGCVPFGTVQPRRPLPNWGGVSLWDDFGFSTYNGLLTKLEKRFSHDFTILVSYTWSKTLDLGSNESFNPVYYPSKYTDFYGPSDIDQTHRINFSYLYKLPVGHGRYWAPNRVVDGIIGGWQLSGITTYHSGTPFSVVYSSSLNNMGVTQLPNRICNGNLSNATYQMWYNPACFVSPIPTNLQSTYNYGFQGNSGHGILRGPPFGTWNIGLTKNFTTFRAQTLQARAEFQNAFNHVNFELPNSTDMVGSSLRSGPASRMRGSSHLLIQLE